MLRTGHCCAQRNQNTDQSDGESDVFAGNVGSGFRLLYFSGNELTLFFTIERNRRARRIAERALYSDFLALSSRSEINSQSSSEGAGMSPICNLMWPPHSQVEPRGLLLHNRVLNEEALTQAELPSHIF